MYFHFYLGTQIAILSIIYSLWLLVNLFGLIGAYKENIQICFVYEIILSIATIIQILVSLQDLEEAILPMGSVIFVFIFIILIKKKYESTQGQSAINNAELNLTDIKY